MACRFCLAYVVLTSFLVAGKSPKYALEGQKVRLMADFTITGQPDQILWLHNGNKVVDFNGNQEQVSNPFKNRITLDWHSAQLDITDLRFEDSGEYELEAFFKKKMHYSFSQLKVMAKVTVPTISCEMNDGASSNISATLVCSVASRHQSALLMWSSHANVQHGPNLTIRLGDTLDDEEYTCSASNPLSNETATFNAKDCYDKSSSVALITSIVFILVIVLVVLGIVFCKLRHKACFVEAKRNDLEGTVQEGRNTQGDERTTLMDRAPTLPSTQRLGHQGYLNTGKDKHETASSPPSTPRSESPSDLDPSNHDNDNKGDAEADQLSEAAEEDVPNPAVLAVLSEGTVSDLESFTAPKNPGSEEKADEGEEAISPTANGVPPPAQPHSPLSQNSPNVTPKDSAGEHEEDPNSDQINGDVTASFRESDSSGIGKTKESDDSSDDEQSATIPEQEGSETRLNEQDSKLSEGEALTNEDNQQETDRPVSAAENESDSVGHGEEFEEPNLYLANSQPLQNPTPTEEDNSTSSTSQESADTAHIDSDEEEEAETWNDSDEVSEDEGESAENKNKFQFGPKEEKPGQGEPQ